MSTEKLWLQLQGGDKSAFEQLYRQEVKVLINYGFRFTSDTQLIEDSVQDLFVELWQKHDRLSPVKSVRSYLMVSLRRKVARRLKRNIRTESPEEVQEEQMEISLAIDEEICQQELETEQLAQLQEALNQLSNRQKEVLYLKYQQGLDYENICEIMDISYQSARNLTASALKRMKGILYMIGVFFLLFLSTNS
ncbi:MAG: sigma-70 family RNA polymerase sigma factor [Chitinophagales bacterium]|nr:sigma-70 family RNA polymerase sigma factor [Chitinophagales bacterium]